ncbi:MAG: hypothetical protein WC502_05145 [Methanolinea sp.]|jgi:hypothetical protein
MSAISPERMEGKTITVQNLNPFLTVAGSTDVDWNDGESAISGAILPSSVDCPKLKSL